MKKTEKLAMALMSLLMAVGAVNWGLVGVLNFDLVAALLGTGSLATRVVYTVVGLCGLAGLWMAVSQAIDAL